MPRIPTITDERILRAAREVFLRRGILATTAEVAECAQVAEGTLFHRYGSKFALFRAAMEADIRKPSWMGMLRTQASPDDPRETLACVLRETLEAFRPVLPLLLMAWSNPAVGAEGALEGGSTTSRLLEELTGYLDWQARQGLLRVTHSASAAESILGTVVGRVLLEILASGSGARLAAPDSFAEEALSMLWSGIAPERRATSTKE